MVSEGFASAHNGLQYLGRRAGGTGWRRQSECDFRVRRWKNLRVLHRARVSRRANAVADGVWKRSADGRVASQTMMREYCGVHRFNSRGEVRWAKCDDARGAA